MTNLYNSGHCLRIKTIPHGTLSCNCTFYERWEMTIKRSPVNIQRNPLFEIMGPAHKPTRCTAFFLAAVVCHIISGPFTIRLDGRRIFLAGLKSEYLRTMHFNVCTHSRYSYTTTLFSPWLWIVRWGWLFSYNRTARAIDLTARHEVDFNAPVLMRLPCHGRPGFKCRRFIV